MPIFEAPSYRAQQQVFIGGMKAVCLWTRFKPVKGWLGGVLSEKIEGWNTKVYEASGKMVAVTFLKGDWHIPSNTTFEEYLEMNVPEDTSVELPVNPTTLNMTGKPEVWCSWLTA